jgi:small subunit ribosomal protein S9
MPKTKEKTKKETKEKPKKETKEKPKKEIKKIDKYYESVGRRKTAVARVRVWTKSKNQIIINDKDYKDYFELEKFQRKILDPLKKMNCEDKFKIQVIVRGGGINAQAEATRHGISRALVLFNSDFKKRLKKVGYLTRDPRMKERKKFGKKGARRSPQWQKR